MSLPKFRWPEDALERAIALREKMRRELPRAEKYLADVEAAIVRQQAASAKHRDRLAEQREELAELDRAIDEQLAMREPAAPVVN